MDVYDTEGIMSLLRSLAVLSTLQERHNGLSNPVFANVESTGG